MKFSDRISRLTASPVRDILRVVDQPGMISFAGGLPDTQSFPELDESLIQKELLQYGATEGEGALRARVAEQLCTRGVQVTPEQVLILSGSQQGIDLVAKLMIDHGTAVAVESPTYLAALQVFSLFGANYQAYVPDHPESLISALPPQLIYTIPTFQNPTGHCYTTAQRITLAEAAMSMGSVLFEDDPYRDLVYEPCDRTPVCAYMKGGSWVYQSSFSKTIAPGLRLGYLACSEDLLQPLARLKQAADLHSNRVSQMLVLSLLSAQEGRLTQLAARYKRKRDVFAGYLSKYLAPYASWSIPQGGLFFWLTLNKELAIDTQMLLEYSLSQNVAFMPGKHFFCDPDSAPGCLRLNFSHASEQQMQTGLATLGTLLQAMADRGRHEQRSDQQTLHADEGAIYR